MKYSDIVQQDRRLAILRFLSEENDYALNDSVLQKALAQFAHNVSKEVILSDFSFLEELGLIEQETVIANKVYVAKITSRGLDVAKGRSIVAGVARPRPE